MDTNKEKNSAGRLDLSARFADPVEVMQAHGFVIGELNGRRGWISGRRITGLVFDTTSSGAWQSINSETGGMVAFGDTAKELDEYLRTLETPASAVETSDAELIAEVEDFKLCPNKNCGNDGEYNLTDTVCPACGSVLALFSDVASKVPASAVEPAAEDEHGSDAEIDWTASALKTVWFTNRLTGSLFLVRCFDGEQMVFEYVHVDEEIAIEAGRDWLLEGDDNSRATVREIKIGDTLSIEAEKEITQ